MFGYDTEDVLFFFLILFLLLTCLWGMVLVITGKKHFQSLKKNSKKFLEFPVIVAEKDKNRNLVIKSAFLFELLKSGKNTDQALSDLCDMFEDCEYYEGNRRIILVPTYLLRGWNLM